MCENASSVARDRPTDETVQLYQKIVIKNFQILKNLLPRMNSIYQLNQELQRSVSNIENRLVKMENDQENLHYEMRTTHLAIDSKLTTIIKEYNNITSETNKVKKQAQTLSREFKEAKTKQFIERTEIEMKSTPYQQKTQQKGKKISFAEKDEAFPNPSKNRTKPFQPSRKSSIELENFDSSLKMNKVHFDIPAPTKRAQQNQNEAISWSIVNEVGVERKKKTSKSNKSAINLSSAKYQKQIKTTKQIQQHIQPNDGKSFEKFLKEIENYRFNNEKMKQNYEELMQEYCKRNQTNFKQLNQKINILNERFNHFDPQNNPLKSIKTAINLQLQPTFHQISASIEEKIDRKMFERIMTEFNTRIVGIHEERTKIANRDETKRAIEFLQKKINGVLNDYYQAKQPSLHHVSVDNKGCLRAADMLNERDAKRYNRNNTLQSQTVTNNSGMVRNDSARTTKRQASSLHSRIMNGTTTQNRFNERQLIGTSTQKCDPLQDSSTRRHQESSNIHFLKKKTHDILDKQKVKGRPKLKKQRLIFQYD